MTESPRTIAIVGAGFSGTTVAVNLLRLSGAIPLRIVLLDPARPARGIAYAERDHPYLLNVPAGRMSASCAAPQDFLGFARRLCPAALAEDFLPRALYGRYLESVLDAAERSAPAHVRLERIAATVHSLRRSSALGAASPIGAALQLQDGREIRADAVVLASGNPPPRRLPATQALLGSPRYIEDPWSGPVAARAGETLLVLGTGLTMADIVTGAMATTQHQLTVHALSRHGLLPLSQSAFGHGGFNADPRPLLHAAAFSMRALLHGVRRLTAQFQARGGDWREVVTFVRNQAPALWQRLPIRERRRFLRHAAAYWDIHRHRLPGQTLTELQALRHGGRLHLHAGRLSALQADADKVSVRWQPRGGRGEATLLVDRVINCTGPDYDCSRTRDPLTRSLLDCGVAAACPLGLGLRTGPCGVLIDARGRAVDGLYYIGPMLRPDCWESTAAHELRGHAERLAQRLSGPAATRAQAQGS